MSIDDGYLLFLTGFLPVCAAGAMEASPNELRWRVVAALWLALWWGKPAADFWLRVVWGAP